MIWHSPLQVGAVLPSHFASSVAKWSRPCSQEPRKSPQDLRLIVDDKDGGGSTGLLVRLRLDHDGTWPVRSCTRTLPRRLRGATVLLRARVVRCTPHVVQLEAAVLARADYQVGLEFHDVSQGAVAALRRIIEPESR